MSTVSSIKIVASRIFYELAGILVGLILSLIVNYVITFQEIRAAGISVRSILSKTEFSSNPYKAAQALESLESIGVLECSVLRIENEPPFYESANKECESNIELYNRELNINILSYSGQNWALNSVVSKNRASTLLEFGFILLMCSLGFVLVKLYRWKIRLKDIEIRSSKEIAALTQRVAHDIRSPLTALNAVTFSSDLNNGDAQEVMKNVVSRINDIANDLLERSRDLGSLQLTRGAGNGGDSFELIGSIQKIILEKKLAYPDFEIRVENQVGSIEINFERNEWERIVSNILENAIDASEEQKLISVSIFETGNCLNISFLDFGRGIPEDVLNQLGRRMVTTKGSKGNGIGFYSASKTIEAAGGSISIHSKVGIGSQVVIKLKK